MPKKLVYSDLSNQGQRAGQKFIKILESASFFEFAAGDVDPFWFSMPRIWEISNSLKNSQLLCIDKINIKASCSSDIYIYLKKLHNGRSWMS